VLTTGLACAIIGYNSTERRRGRCNASDASNDLTPTGQVFAACVANATPKSYKPTVYATVLINTITYARRRGNAISRNSPISSLGRISRVRNSANDTDMEGGRTMIELLSPVGSPADLGLGPIGEPKTPPEAAVEFVESLSDDLEHKFALRLLSWWAYNHRGFIPGREVKRRIGFGRARQLEDELSKRLPGGLWPQKGRVMNYHELKDALEVYKTALHNASEEIRAWRKEGHAIAIECEYLQKAQEELDITLRE